VTQVYVLLRNTSCGTTLQANRQVDELKCEIMYCNVVHCRTQSFCLWPTVFSAWKSFSLKKQSWAENFEVNCKNPVKYLVFSSLLIVLDPHRFRVRATKVPVQCSRVCKLY